jgi:hypothetical protein
LSQPITITIPVDLSYNGQILSVYQSEDGGVTWTEVTTCTVVSGACSFPTSNLSSFAVVVPTITTTTPPPSSVVSVASGGGGGGGSYYAPVTTGNISSSTATSISGMTIAQLQALLASLEAQLQSLEAEAGNTTSSHFLFTRDLSYGMTGNDVEQLQQFLIAQNIGSAAERLKANGATKNFGTLTQAALIEFQKHAGITPSVGYFGPKTRTYVNTQE